MNYKEDTVKDLRIAYIGGGSRGWAWTFMRDLVKAIDWHPVGNSIIVEIYNVRREESKGTRLACDI